MASLNAMRWDGSAGHYEVWYLTLTDPAGGVGVWIRLTMVAPLAGEPTCSLWFLAMDPATGELTGRKATYPIGELTGTAQPFALDVAGATLGDRGTRGASRTSPGT